MADKFINIDELNIDLIDKVNPFQKAFEILSKNVTAQLLKVIRRTIESQKILMTMKKRLFYIKKWVFYKKHNREPN